MSIDEKEGSLSQFLLIPLEPFYFAVSLWKTILLRAKEVKFEWAHCCFYEVSEIKLISAECFKDSLSIKLGELF